MRSTLSISLTLALASQGVSQVGGEWNLIQSNDGPATRSKFGTAVCFLDDLNGDGVAEILAGAPDWLGSLGTTDGMAEVRDGATGAVLRTHFASDPPGGNLGHAVARVADLDLDGIDDYLISEPTGNGPRYRLGLVYAFSGASGLELWRAHGDQSWANFGWTIAGVDDITGDGIPDVIVGWPEFEMTPFGDMWRGAATLVSGADGSKVSRIIGKEAGDGFGGLVHQVGDVNGDGYRDIGVSWRGHEFDSPGYLSIYSGLDLKELRVLQGPPTSVFNSTGWGRAFCSLGDLDGDGADELAVGAPWQDVGTTLSAGQVTVYHGRTGEVLWTRTGDGIYRDFGHQVVAAGDLDGDGAMDLAVSELQPIGEGAVHLLSGWDGRTLAMIEGGQRDAEFGFDLDASADLNGDGRNDILIGALEEYLSRPDTGRYDVWSWNPMLDLDARTASNSASGVVTLSVDLPSTEAGQSYSLLLSKTGVGPTSLGGVLVPLSQDQLLDRTRRGNPPTSFSNANGTLDGNGDASITFTWSAGDFVGEVGLTYWASVVSHDASGIRTVSSAMPLTITP